MAAQTVKFILVEGETNSVCKAYSLVDGTLAGTSATLAAADTSGVEYAYVFTDLPAAEYKFVAVSSGGYALDAKFGTVLLATGTYPIYYERSAERYALASEITTLRGADSDTLKTLSDQIDGIAGGAGTGARTVTVTVDDGTTAVQNATVRMSEGVNTYTAPTNPSGVAVFNLDDATYTVGISKSGYTFAGTTLVVDGAEVVTYSMTQVTPTSPTDPELSAIEVLCLGADFQAEADVNIDFRMVTIPSGDTNIAYFGAKTTVASNVNGIARFEGPRGSVIQYKRGRADVWLSVTLDSDSATNVTSFIGSP